MSGYTCDMHGTTEEAALNDVIREFVHPNAAFSAHQCIPISDRRLSVRRLDESGVSIATEMTVATTDVVSDDAGDVLGSVMTTISAAVSSGAFETELAAASSSFSSVSVQGLSVQTLTPTIAPTPTPTISNNIEMVGGSGSPTAELIAGGCGIPAKCAPVDVHAVEGCADSTFFVRNDNNWCACDSQQLCGEYYGADVCCASIEGDCCTLDVVLLAGIIVGALLLCLCMVCGGILCVFKMKNTPGSDAAFQAPTLTGGDVQLTHVVATPAVFQAPTLTGGDVQLTHVVATQAVTRAVEVPPRSETATFTI